MAYKKRYNNKRRKNRKFNKYVYAKTDSRNQAKQIVSLNKKINNVYKSIKPEIKRINFSGEKTVSGDAFAAHDFTAFIGGTPGTIFQGDYTKFIYFNFRICFNLNGVDLTKGHSFRLIIFQSKFPIATPPNIGDLLDTSGIYGIISPFKNNVGARYKILLSKVINLSSEKDFVYRSYNFKKLIGYKKINGESSAVDIPRGAIMAYVIAPTGQGEVKYYVSSKFGYIDN